MSLDLSKTATRLLKTLASDKYVILRQVNDSSTNPVTGVTVRDTNDVYLVAAVTSVPDYLLSGQGTGDGTRILATDKIVVCDNQVQPKMNDIIVIPDDDGQPVEHKIVEIGGSNHAGIRQVYRVVCRG